jgi:hypothetical protein
LRCVVCSREAQTQSEYCEKHGKAYNNILEKFVVWKRASSVEWKNYLEEILKNPLTGTWAKEVAEKLLIEKA